MGVSPLRRQQPTTKADVVCQCPVSKPGDPVPRPGAAPKLCRLARPGARKIIRLLQVRGAAHGSGLAAAGRGAQGAERGRAVLDRGPLLSAEGRCEPS